MISPVRRTRLPSRCRREQPAAHAGRAEVRRRLDPGLLRAGMRAGPGQGDEAQQRESAENHDGREQRGQPGPQPGCPPAGLRVPAALPQQPAEQAGQCHLRADGDRSARACQGPLASFGASRALAARGSRRSPQDQQPGQEQPDPGRVRARTGPPVSGCPAWRLPRQSRVPVLHVGAGSRPSSGICAKPYPSGLRAGGSPQREAPTTGGADAISLRADDAVTGWLPVW